MAAATDQDEHDFRILDLGPVAIEHNGVQTALTGKAALAVALLAARFPQAVQRQAFFDLLWDDDSTGDHANGLRVLIHRVRQLLGSSDRLRYSGEAYRLEIAPSQLDSAGFEQLVRHASDQLADQQAVDARHTLDQALSLWRGSTAGAEPHRELQSWQAHLDTVRLDAEEDRIQTLLASGDSGLAAVDARGLVDEAPYRERRWELLMLALYQSGRQQEALEAAADAALLLRSDLGVEPGPALRQLEHDILTHAAHLEPNTRLLNELPAVPALVGALLGRSDELALAHECWRQHRVVTVSGPGGIGKTSLALSIAHRLASEGVELWWCDLSGVSGDVALHVGLAAGVRSGSDDVANLAKILNHRAAATLVLDNCEHLLAEVQSVVKGLAGAPNVKVIATSRRPLGLAGEAVIRLGPLDDEPAVDVFQRAAQAAAPATQSLDRDHVRRVCERLDGIPLAIELVARRARSFSVREIEEHLDSLLFQVGDHAPESERHATMSTALAWSVDFLSHDARLAAGAASVFPGTFDLAAFEALVAGRVDAAAPVVLDELVGEGLLQVTTRADRTRYRMLQPIRHFARGELADHAELDADRHLAHYLARLESAYDMLASTSSEPLRDLIATDLHNLAAVHEYALLAGRLDDDMRLYRPLNVAHLYDHPEPFLWARETVQIPEASHCERYGDALHAAWYGALAVQLDTQAAVALAAELDALHQVKPHDLAQLATGLHALLMGRDYDLADAAFRAVEVDDPYVRYVVTSVGASVRLTEAERKGHDKEAAISTATESIDQSLKWARAIGAENFEAGLLEQQAQVQLAAGAVQQARDMAAEAQQRAQSLGMGHIDAQAQFQLVRCDVMQGQMGAEVALRLADALDLGVHSSAQARLRWQLPVAAQVLVANDVRQVAACCLAASGFSAGTRDVGDALSDEERATGSDLANQLSLLDIAALAVAELRAI